MVKRYTIEAACCLGMEQHISETADDEGDWVRYSDYEELLEKHGSLNEDYEFVCGEIRMLANVLK